MKTGLMLTLPGGSKFWHPCADDRIGAAEMDQRHAEANTYGANYRHADAVLEFGTDDGRGTFTPTNRIRGPVEKANAPVAEKAVPPAARPAGDLPLS